MLKEAADAYDELGAAASTSAGWIALNVVNFAKGVSYVAGDMFSNLTPAERAKRFEEDQAKRKEEQFLLDGNVRTDTSDTLDKKAVKPLVDSYKGLTDSQFKMKALTDERAAKEKLMIDALASNSPKAQELARDFHEADIALKAYTKELAAEAAKKAGIAGMVTTSERYDSKGNENAMVGVDAKGKPIYSQNPYAGTSTVTRDPTTGREYSAEEMAAQRDQRAFAMQSAGMGGDGGYAAEMELVKRVLFTGGFNTPEFADLRKVAGGMGTVSAAQGGVKQEWQYSHTAGQTAATLREAYSKGLAAAGITINNINNGYATPAEIAEATAKSVSEALAKQATT